MKKVHDCDQCKKLLTIMPINFGERVYYFPHEIGVVFGEELAKFLSVHHNCLKVAAITSAKVTHFTCPGQHDPFLGGYWVVFH